MGQIKNIKLHIVTDIKYISDHTHACTTMNAAGALVRYGRAVMKLGRVVSPRVSRWGKLAAVEMAPPSPKELIGELGKLKDVNLMGVMDMSVNEVAARGFVLAELCLIFCIGEVIGKGTVVGYNPPVDE